MPAEMRDLLERNNLGPGILSRKLGLQYGQGPYLYQLELKDNEINKTWLKTKRFRIGSITGITGSMCVMLLLSLTMVMAFFAKYFSARSRRLGKAFISRIQALHSTDCRMEYPGKDKSLEDVQTFM